MRGIKRYVDGKQFKNGKCGGWEARQKAAVKKRRNGWTSIGSCSQIEAGDLIPSPCKNYLTIV
jgi:hypothetical protein